MLNLSQHRAFWKSLKKCPSVILSLSKNDSTDSYRTLRHAQGDKLGLLQKARSIYKNKRFSDPETSSG
jgi:hypothetical protein